MDTIAHFIYAPPKEEEEPLLSEKVILLGKTGAGKSTLACNLTESKDLFKICNGIKSGQHGLQFKGVSMPSQLEKRFLMCDIPGAGDSEGKDEVNLKILIEACHKLSSANCFIFVMNSQEKRFDKF
jgi:predicted GTPase